MDVAQVDICMYVGKRLLAHTAEKHMQMKCSFLFVADILGHRKNNKQLCNWIDVLKEEIYFYVIEISVYSL